MDCGEVQRIMSNEKGKRGRLVLGDRPPAFVSKATLAAELDISESTIENYVNAGILPQPRKLKGAVRWRWADVEAAICSMGGSQDSDPFMLGISNVR